MNTNPYRLDYFILKNGKHSNSEYALRDYSVYNRSLTIDFYYYKFYYKLFIEYSGLEYLDFLKFQIENSEYGYRLVTFLKEDFLKIKNICKTNDKVEYQHVIHDIMKKTNSDELFSYYGQQMLMDPELLYSGYYFEKFIISNKDIVKLRIKEINKQLKIYSEKYFISQKKIADEEIIDVEVLKTKGQRIMMLKELGVLDFLEDKCKENGSLRINKLSNLIHCFTDLGSRSIQSILNPMYNTRNNQRNNPYNNEHNLPKVKAKLAEIKINI